MPFFQTPPSLGNQYANDRVLRTYVARKLPADVLRDIEPSLDEMGELAGGRLYRRLVEEYDHEPRVVPWDAWGQRIDRIEVTPLWQELFPIAVQKGIIATAYERKHGRFSRTHQFALAYLLDASSGVFSCPMAMTDGASRTLLDTGNRAIIDRAIPRLTSRDPARAWTSGQWMTERTGGSDVAISETVARPDPTAGPDAFRLYGTKWFTSATTSEMALTLARPEGNPPGGSGLALFYVELRDDAGRLRNIAINRLKDKLGTRMVPTAELTLDGAPAIAVSGLRDGIKNITPMLSVTRTWNAVCAAAGMRRGLALARDYAKKRIAFGAPLADKPLHADTLAALQAEYEGAFLLTFRVVELLGKDEAGELTEREGHLLRMLTPIAKLTTGKQGVAVASEVLEAFGGAGYVEDTGLPRLLRDAQVLPIWEGTTNVLSLDLLRVMSRGGSLAVIEEEVRACTETATDDGLRRCGEIARSAVAHARAWAENAREAGPAALEAGARRLAMTLGRAMELAFLVEHAAWAQKTNGDARPAASARFLARTGIDSIVDDDFMPGASTLARYDE